MQVTASVRTIATNEVREVFVEAPSYEQGKIQIANRVSEDERIEHYRVAGVGHR